MSVDDPPIPMKRSRLNDDELDQMSKEELMSLWRTQEQYIDSLEAKSGSGETLAMLEEKVKQGTRREQVLVMRLTTKEHEMQEYLNQIQELKQGNNHSTAQLRSALLDPAVNLMFERLKKELEETKQKLEQTKNDLGAWKFTADSQTGKRLMAKCRMLLQENEELGKVTSSGRIAKLEGSIALEKTLVQEMKKGQAEIDDFLVELEEDLEGMQSTIYLLQQQLKEAKDEIKTLKEENASLKQGQEGVTGSPTSQKLLSENEANEQVLVTKPDTSSEPDGPPVLHGSPKPCPAPSTEETDTSLDVENSRDDFTAASSGTEEMDSSPGTPGTGESE